jgi:NitT/TauT family transport system substrate-binding protein
MNRTDQIVRPGHRARLTAMTALAGLLILSGLAPAEAQTKVRYVEVVRSLAYLPSYVAIAKGYFEEEGLKVDMSTAWGGDKATAQTLTGHAEITLLGPETAVYVQNSASPEKLRIFCSLTLKDVFLLTSREKSAPGKFDWSTVKGKTMIGFRPGSTPQLFLEYALKKNGIDPVKDLNIITNIAIPARTGAWVAGQGQFAIIQEPHISRLEQQGKGFVVASIGQEVGPVDYTVFVATDAFIKKNPKVIQAWTNAIYKAQKFTAGAETAELARLVAPYFPKVSEQLLANGIERYRGIDMWRNDPVVPKPAIEKLQDILIEGEVLKPDQRVTYEDIVVTRFAEKAKAMVK